MSLSSSSSLSSVVMRCAITLSGGAALRSEIFSGVCWSSLALFLVIFCRLIDMSSTCSLTRCFSSSNWRSSSSARIWTAARTISLVTTFFKMSRTFTALNLLRLALVMIDLWIFSSSSELLLLLLLLVLKGTNMRIPGDLQMQN